jgi:hypothetical protein
MVKVKSLNEPHAVVLVARRSGGLCGRGLRTPMGSMPDDPFDSMPDGRWRWPTPLLLPNRCNQWYHPAQSGNHGRPGNYLCPRCVPFDSRWDAVIAQVRLSPEPLFPRELSERELTAGTYVLIRFPSTAVVRWIKNARFVPLCASGTATVGCLMMMIGGAPTLTSRLVASIHVLAEPQKKKKKRISNIPSSRLQSLNLRRTKKPVDERENGNQN